MDKERKFKCGNCAYWQNQVDDSDKKPAYGECRRYPPTYKQNGRIVGIDHYDHTEYMMDVSPFEIIMHESSWCGEFFKKKDET